MVEQHTGLGKRFESKLRLHGGYRADFQHRQDVHPHTISKIESGDFGNLIKSAVSGLEYTIEGTWSENDGTYTLHFANYNDATFTMEEGATGIKLSFSISFNIIVSIDIEVKEQTLIPGTIADNAEADPEQ